MPAAADICIRPVALADLGSLLALYRHLNPEDPEMAEDLAADRFRQVLDHPGMTVLAAFDERTAVSSVTLMVVPNITRGGSPYALIENVVTHAAYRKRGHARTLIDRATALTWEAGCYKVMLLTGSQDPATLRFYANCGFAQNKTGFQMRRPLAGL
jgi:GNAT superfamily N-acetyltransferase